VIWEPNAQTAPHVTIARRVEWPDTDAAGHYHHSTALRWAEAAEAELYDRHGVVDLFGVVPRVRLEVNHRARLWFRDEVEISLRVARLGTTSITHEFAVRRGGELAVDGVLVGVHIDPAAGKATPWPEAVRDCFGIDMP
jgi:acyl-CoA thioester hydrolase